MRALVIALPCFLLALPLQAGATGFHFREQEGWFWYDREPEPVEVPEPKKPEPPTVPDEPPLSENTPTGPHPLSAQWLREQMGAYRDAAIDDPTP